VKEIIKLSILEEYIPLIFPEMKEDSGRFARQISLERGDPILDKIARMDRQIHNRTGARVFYGFDIIREYSSDELGNASYFYLKIKPSSYFDPVGEECGTHYEDLLACNECGAGGQQVGPLYLKTKFIPKRTDIAATIAGEIVVSGRLADLMQKHAISGVVLAPVFEIGRGGVTETGWYQWLPSSPFFDIVAPTMIRESLFDEEVTSCPCGDTLGSNLLSEIFLIRPLQGGADVMWSRQYIGRRIGFLRPRQVAVVGKKLINLMSTFEVKGFDVEVAHAKSSDGLWS
jgi:hypothetical protein